MTARDELRDALFAGYTVEGRERLHAEAEADALIDAATDEAVRAVQGWMALDLHMALGKPVDHSATHQGYGSWAGWWAELCAEVRSWRPTVATVTEWAVRLPNGEILPRPSQRSADTIRAVHLGRRSPAGRLIYLANRLEAALDDGTITPTVLATVNVLRTTAEEMKGGRS